MHYHYSKSAILGEKRCKRSQYFNINHVTSFVYTFQYVRTLNVFFYNNIPLDCDLIFIYIYFFFIGLGTVRKRYCYVNRNKITSSTQTSRATTCSRHIATRRLRSRNNVIREYHPLFVIIFLYILTATSRVVHV